MKTNRNLIQAVRLYKFQSLFIKSLILIFLLVIVPFTGLSVVMYLQMNKAIETEVSSINMNSLYRVKDSIDNIFKQMDRVSLEMIYQDDVGSFMLSDFINSNPAKMQTIRDKISMYTRSFKYIDSLYVFSDKNNYMLSNRSNSSLEEFDDKSWYSSVYQKMDSNLSYLDLRKRNDTYPFYISITRPAYLYEDKIGAVTANIDLEELSKFLNQTSEQFENTYIVNGDVVLYSLNRNEFMSNIQDIDLLNGADVLADNKEPHSSIKTIHGQKYIHSVLPSGDKGLTYISLLPLINYEQKMKDLRAFLYVFFGIGTIIVLIVSLLISIKTFSPVNQIMSMIEDQEKLEPLMISSEKSKWNEVRTITNSIFRTLDAKKGLEQELQLRMHSLRKAQTIALQNQTTPHFLYNTLETIKYLAIELTKGHNPVSHMVTALSDLLRRSLDTDNPLTDIRDEVQHAKQYVEIMQARYPNKFDVVWQIQESLLTCHILKISIQPLLENAFQHGIIPTRNPGQIIITGLRTSDGIVITVSDNGIGMPDAQLKKLQQSMASGVNLEEKHIGLKNLNQRIKLIFGDEFGVFITRNLHRGTAVFIVIPEKKDLHEIV
ncbi:two-component system sensor histidine kinase YesM [Paenibacillus sp. V4I3]|uniref:sensor histidine kinase n=1 Tax=Paenibacillus sp. V4I3 TaxID=3042305 RepID=UPI0027880C77|nr:histidine kinase [Paenibacillus sp. V4I3]MDQ0874643.1 two-component system sensor histidine kinase YesM [Paenibacillus sp. V4I3]